MDDRIGVGPDPDFDFDFDRSGGCMREAHLGIRSGGRSAYV